MIISLTTADGATGTTELGLIADAFELLRPAIGPIRFKAGTGGQLQLTLVAAGPDWQEWQTLAVVEPDAATRRAQVAIRRRPDWFPTREAGFLAWAVLEASIRLLLGPEHAPHPLPKTCLNHVIPTDRIEAFSLLRGGYICKSCCETLLARGVSPFAVSQLQDATQLVRAVLIVPQLYRPQPGRLRLVERQGQLVAELPDYGGERLPLQPLELAFYLLLLRHENGIPTDLKGSSRLEDLTRELTELYSRANPTVRPGKARSRAERALRANGQRELTSFLNTCLTEHTPTAVAHKYQVVTTPTGQKKRQIHLDRGQVEDLANVLSTSPLRPHK